MVHLSLRDQTMLSAHQLQVCKFHAAVSVARNHCQNLGKIQGKLGENKSDNVATEYGAPVHGSSVSLSLYSKWSCIATRLGHLLKRERIRESAAHAQLQPHKIATRDIKLVSHQVSFVFSPACVKN